MIKKAFAASVLSACLTAAISNSTASADAQALRDDQLIPILQIILGGYTEPEVEAGDDVASVAASTVRVRGDVSGNYLTTGWSQLAGPEVEFDPSAGVILQFIAPEVSDPTELIFEFVATYESGESLTDQVSVTIYPNLPPELIVDFPCDGCRTYGSAISLRGRVTPGADDPFVASQDSTTVNITIGTEAHEASVDEAGIWILDDLPIPENTTDYVISITASDSFGALTVADLNLQQAPTFNAPMIAADPVKEGRLYLFEAEQLERLISFDSNTNIFTTIYEDRNFPLGGFGQSVGSVMDPDGSRVIFAEFGTGRIGAINVNDGTLSTVSSNQVGNGPALSLARNIGVDIDDRRLVVFDVAQEAVFLVDLDSGDRSLLRSDVPVSALAVDSDNDLVYLYGTDLLKVNLDTGETSTLVSGPLELVSSMAYNPDTAQLSTSSYLDLVRVFETSNGASSVLSAPGTDGIKFGTGRQIIVDPHANRYLVNDNAQSSPSYDTNAIIAIDGATGARSLIYRDQLATGPDLEYDISINLSTDAMTIWAVSSYTDNVIAVDLASRNRTLVADNQTGFGPSLNSPRDVLELTSNKLLVSDAGLGSILSVDVTSGDRTYVSGAGKGAGPDFSPTSIDLDREDNVLYALDITQLNIVAVDLATGDRTIISDNTTNTGPEFLEPTALVLDAARQRLLVADNGTGATTTLKVISVDLATGNRSTLSGYGIGSGPNFSWLADIVLDQENDRALIATGKVPLAVNLSNGNRSDLVDSGIGNGELKVADRIAYNTTTGLLYGWTARFNGLTLLDPISGDQVVVSK